MDFKLFSQQKEIQRQQKMIEDLEAIITKTRRVSSSIHCSNSRFPTLQYNIPFA